MPSDASSSPDAAAAARAFAEHCIDVNAARMWVILRVILAIVLVAGPIQYLLLAPPAAFWQLVRMSAVFVTFVVVTIALRTSAALRRRSDVACAVMTAVAMAIEARVLTRIGGLETLYTGIACVTPMGAITFLVPLRRRLWLAALPAVAFYGVFFAFRPSAMHQPYAAMPVFHASLAIGLAVIFGDMSYHLAREHHAQRRQLAGEATRLEAAVRARTSEVIS